MRKFALPLTASAIAFAPGKSPPPTVGAAMKLNVTLPETKRRRAGGTSFYPFDGLTEVGMVFGVMDRSAKQLSSIVSAQNRKHVKPVLDANGQPTYGTKAFKQPDGSEIQVPDVEKPITTVEKHFIAIDVTPEIAAAIKNVKELAGVKTLVRRDV